MYSVGDRVEIINILDESDDVFMADDYNYAEDLIGTFGEVTEISSDSQYQLRLKLEYNNQIIWFDEKEVEICDKVDIDNSEDDFNIGDIVTVINKGYTYDSYKRYLTDVAGLHHLSKYFIEGDLPKANEEYMILYKGKNYIIQEMFGEQVYVMDERGLVKYKEE